MFCRDLLAPFNILPIANLYQIATNKFIDSNVFTLRRVDVRLSINQPENSQKKIFFLWQRQQWTLARPKRTVLCYSSDLQYDCAVLFTKGKNNKREITHHSLFQIWTQNIKPERLFRYIHFLRLS